MKGNVRNILIWIIALAVIIIALRFAFKLGFIVLVLSLGFYLGYQYKKKQSNNKN